MLGLGNKSAHFNSFRILKSKQYNIFISAFLATCTVFVVNAIIPSFVNGFTPGLNFDLSNLIENIRSEELFHSRYEHSEYGRRLIVLGIQKWAYDIGVPYQLSFNLINLVANYCFFYFGYQLASIKYKSLNPYLFMGFLALSFPVLFAYLPVIFTYDDTAQFALLTGFFLCLYKEKRPWAYVLFFLACLSRETTVLFGTFLPIYFWMEKKNLKQLILELLPYGLIVILYVVILILRMDEQTMSESASYMGGKRFEHFRYNFSDIWRGIEVAFYITASYLLAFILLKDRLKKPQLNAIYSGFLSLFVFNLLVCIIATHAIEARFYTMTLIPIFPLLGVGLEKCWKLISDKTNFNLQFLIVSVLFSSGLISLYHPQVKRAYYVFAPYLFVYFSFCIYLILIKRKQAVNP